MPPVTYSTPENSLNHPSSITAALCAISGVGPRYYWSLVEQLGAIESLWHCPIQKIVDNSPTRAKKGVLDFLTHRENSQTWTQVLKEREQLRELGGQLISHWDTDYPELLRQLPDAPPVLYLLGDSDLLATPQLAIVGSRNCSPYGSRNAHNFAHYLASSGFTITSGMAHGIDKHAHVGALDANGRTIAVLGTGCNVVYPKAHQQLYGRILENRGLIVSELPLGSSPRAGNFPRRNRIISGLSLGTLVVEATRNSGSLITAKLAMEQNREVYAIPGNINHPQSRGCHDLLRQGATLVETAEDIVNELRGWQTQAPPSAQHLSSQKPIAVPTDLSPSQTKIIETLTAETLHADELASVTQFDISNLLTDITELEILGLVVSTPDGYQRC